jgi:hypothetical protein
MILEGEAAKLKAAWTMQVVLQFNLKRDSRSVQLNP